MGAWGGGLFESDADLDILCDLSSDVGVKLAMHDQDGELTVDSRTGSDPPDDGNLNNSSQGGNPNTVKTMTAAETRIHLDNGNFTRVFNKYKAKKVTDHMFGLSWPMAGGNYLCVLLAAAAMKVGADITDEQREYLESQYKSCGLMSEGIEQVENALKNYKNGIPYELEAPDRTRAAREMEARNAESRSTGRYLMLNHFGERFFDEAKGTPDFNQRMMGHFDKQKCCGCGKPELALAGRQKLKNCAKCKKVLYCGRECQKKDWKSHKKDCARLAAGKIDRPSKDVPPVPAGDYTLM